MPWQVASCLLSSDVYAKPANPRLHVMTSSRKLSRSHVSLLNHRMLGIEPYSLLQGR